MRTQRVVVIGAGIAGLATAYRISRLAAEKGIALDLQVLEREESPGGKIQTAEENGFLLEKGPNGYLDNEPATLRLVKDLGIADRVLRSSDASRNRFIYRKGILHQLEMNPIRFFKSSLLSRMARLRIVREYFVSPRKPGVTEETVGDFGRRRLGKEFTSVFLDSMVSGIYAGDVDRLSVDAAFPKVVEMERDYGGLIRALLTRQKERRKRLKEKRRLKAQGQPPEPKPEETEDREVQAGPSGVLHSFHGGMRDPIESLVSHLKKGSVRCGVRARSVESYGPRGGYRIRTDGGEIDADIVVFAVPSHVTADLVDGFSVEAAETLRNIPYAGVHVICLGYKREQVGHSLDGFGVLIPRREKIRTLGSLWSSTIYGNRAPEGHVLMRCMFGGRHDPGANELSEEQMLRAVRDEMEPLFEIQGEPALAKVFRWDRGIPQYELGHGTKVERAGEALKANPGLFLTGNSICGISFNNCIAHSEKVAGEVLDFLENHGSEAGA